MSNYLVATVKSWNVENFKRLKREDRANRWFLISRKEDLVLKKLEKINPRYIFFPHWSWFIPPEIYDHFECVVFHMTDLPYGRGGSPLQNLIVRGKVKTKISAIKVVKALDAGPVYFKKNLNLKGSADNIFRRASKIVFAAIEDIVKKEPLPKPQEGRAVFFSRRKPGEGDLSPLKSIKEVYNHIRMLDAEGYPRAFLEKDGIRLEFEKAELKKDEISAKVKITIKNNNE